MEKLHLDIWLADDTDGKIGVFMYSKGGQYDWFGVEVDNIQANQWNSIDIDLSDYKASPLSPVSALAVSGGVTDQTAGKGFGTFNAATDIYVANAYFYSTGVNPMLNVSLQARTANSVSLIVKGIKSINASDNNLAYTVSYGENQTATENANSGEEKVITIDNLTPSTNYTFTVEVKDDAGNAASKTIDVTTLAESAAAPTYVPDIISGYGEVTKIFTYEGNATNYGWANWGTNSQGEQVIINGRPAFLIKNFDKYGSQWDAVNAVDKGVTKLHIDVYPLQDMQIGIRPITNADGQNQEEKGVTFENLTKGEWHSLVIDLNELTNQGLDFTSFYQLKYIKDGETDENSDGTKSFYVGNVYLYNDAADDGKDPIIKTASVSNTTVASANISVIATDNSEDLTFKVVAKDAEGKEITATAKGKSGEQVSVNLTGLDMNTEYTATVTVSDKTRTSEAQVLTFTTKQLPHATRPEASKFYYENAETNLRGFLGEGTGLEGYTGKKEEIGIGNGDNVLKFYGDNNVFGLNINQDDEFGTESSNNIIGIAIYPIDITEIQVAPRIWSETDEFQTKIVKPNEWNYITMKPLENYTGGNNFIGIVFKGANGNTVFVDNFYMFTSADITAPTVELKDIDKEDVHVNSVEISFSGTDDDTSIKFEIWLKNLTEGPEYQAGFTTAESGETVSYYLKGLKSGTEYKLYVKGRDEAENAGTSATKTFTTKSFTETISVDIAKTKSENGGLVVLKGIWNLEEFNKIAAEYPYGCFDVRNVQFNTEDRLDRGANGIKLFNHNAYFITDINNKFDGNYVQPEDGTGEFIGMNFQWYDGDFKPENGPDGYVGYEQIISDYKTNYGEYTQYPGISSLGYIKMDPYTGYDLHFKAQGASITRQMFMGDKANKYSTMICPFALNTDNVKNCDFYELTTPEINGETVTLNFTQVTEKTEANKPYLMKVTNDGTGGTAYFVDNDGETEKMLKFSEISNTKEIKGEEVGNGGTTAYLYGTYVTSTVGNDVYGLKQGNNELTLVSAANSELPAFRAAVHLTLPASAKKIVLSFDGETTGISEISGEAISEIFGSVYSIDGKVVGNANNGFVNLPAGIYVVNGKKVVIK